MSSASLAALAPYHLRRIAFVKANKPDAVPVPTGLDIVVLNADQSEDMRHGKTPLTGGQLKSAGASTGAKSRATADDLSLQWRTVQKMGPGLVNLGNTCFMNSVLQCLTHTPPLAEALLSGNGCVPGVKAHGTRAFSAKSHKLGHSNGGVDSLALTRAHIERSLRHRSGVISPTAHVRSLRSISKGFQRGRQEDAHEYLIALLDSMHTMAVGGPAAKPSPSVSAASLIHRIFAGRICSKVTCMDCGYESNTFDPFLDISLEINRASSVKKALERFTASESLDGSNKYKCPRQNRMVRAAKRMVVEDAPAVLVVQLKRFEFSARSRTKISKRVDFDTTLDLSPFMSKRQKPVRYQLFGVLVHHGHSLHAGHYVSFVRGPNGLWHLMDDSCVSQVSERMVLGQKAYMLFYLREEAGSNGSMSVVTRTQEGMIANGPQSLRCSSDHKVKPPAVQSTVPTSKLQSDVAQSSLVASAAATIAPQTVAQGPKPGNAPLAAATAAKRKSVGADSQLAQSPPVKRHRVSSQSDDDDPAAVGSTPSGSAAVSEDTVPAARQYHVRLRKEIVRALSVSWPNSPSQLGRGQRRLERHLLEHRNRCVILSRAASRDLSPAAGGSSLAAPVSQHLARVHSGRAPAAADAAVPPALSPRRLRLRAPGSSRSSSHPAAITTAAAAQTHMLPIGSPAQSIDDSGASGDNPTASNPASMARIGSPPVEAPSWPPLPSASVQQDGVLPSVTVSGSAVAAVASPPEVPQQHQKRSKRPARAEAISSVTGAEAATALLQGGQARSAAGWALNGSAATDTRSGGIDDYDVAYDRGRVKKVQQKGVAADGISAATIQVAWEDSRRNHGGRSKGMSVIKVGKRAGKTQRGHETKCKAIAASMVFSARQCS